MREPRIGLSTYRERAAWGVWDQSADLLPSSYAKAVTSSGGVALLLPPAAPELADAVLDGLDGLLLAGGADIEAARYGRPRGVVDDEPRLDRDAWELALAEAALRQGIPVLGICRGLQVLNVLLGGTLVQHLGDRDASGEADSKLHRPAPGVFNNHRVTTAPGSRVAGVIGESCDSSCAHHQAIDDLAEDLVATAWAGDGVIEAVELPGENWVVGVQWHPEVTGGGPLLDAFVTACRAHRDSPAGVAAG